MEVSPKNDSEAGGVGSLLFREGWLHGSGRTVLTWIRKSGRNSIIVMSAQPAFLSVSFFCSQPLQLSSVAASVHVLLFSWELLRLLLLRGNVSSRTQTSCVELRMFRSFSRPSAAVRSCPEICMICTSQLCTRRSVFKSRSAFVADGKIVLYSRGVEYFSTLSHTYVFQQAVA